MPAHTCYPSTVAKVGGAKVQDLCGVHGRYKASLSYTAGLYGAIHFLAGLELSRFPAVGGVGASPCILEYMFAASWCSVKLLKNAM